MADAKAPARSETSQSSAERLPPSISAGAGGPATGRAPRVAVLARKAATSLALILFVAFAARIAFAWREQATTPHWILGTISFLYEPGNIAHSLALGRGFSSPFRQPTGPTAWEAPAYPFLLSLIFRAWGTYTFAAFVAAIAFNILCSGLVCVPVFYAGRRLGGAATGSAGAWLWAIFPNAVIVPSQWIWDTCLSALLAATILWATLALGDSRPSAASEPAPTGAPRRNWVPYGLLWGLALLTNPTLGGLLPFLLGWLIWRGARERKLSRASMRAALLSPALALGIAVLCCVPWTIRNYGRFHAFVPIRSPLGLQLWLGNNDAYRNSFPSWLHPIDNDQERAQYVRMGEIPYMSEKLREALRWIAAHPRREAQLCASRFVATWTGVPSVARGWRTAASNLVRALIAGNLALSLAALAGIVALYRRRNPFAFPVLIFPLVYPIAFYLSQALLRYRYPVDPALMLLAASAPLAFGFRKPMRG